MTRRALRSIATPHVLRRAGAAFLTGPRLTDAMAVARRLDAQGIAVTLAYWDGRQDNPATIEHELTRSLVALAALRCAPRLSVKVPPLSFDPYIVARLAERARQVGGGLVFDAHGPERADATLALAHVAAHRGADIGVAVPARWQRSVTDAREALAAGLRVRVVKGQWRDLAGGGPLSARGLEEAFLRLTATLPGPPERVGVATHDHRLLRTLTSGELRRAFGELELLFGMPGRQALRIARGAGLPVRCYVPFGHPSIGFDLHELRNRPRLGVNLARGLLLGRANQPRRLDELTR